MKFASSILDEVIVLFNWPNPSIRTVALGSTQPLTEMSTRNLPGGKGRPAPKADNLTSIWELTYGPPRPVTGIAILVYLFNINIITRENHLIPEE
jgi:hypothetical protein